MEEQRVAIKFCVKAGKSAVETIELINKAYGSAAMSHANVYRWYAHFRDRKEDVKDNARSSRPLTARTDEKRGICSSSADRRPSYHSPSDCRSFEYWQGDSSLDCNRRLGKKKDLRKICSSRLDHRAETRTHCLLPGFSFNGTR